MYRSESERYTKAPNDLLYDAVVLNEERGSSTCCILTLQENENKLASCNLGDAGFTIIRSQLQEDKSKDLSIIYQSKEQQHGFNFPYQVGTNGDDPRQAQSNVHDIEHGDILIVGSDGLWDNLYLETIIETIKTYITWDEESNIGIIEDVDEVAERLANVAKQYSV